MGATDFELRHPLLIRQAIILAAFATYFADRDDVIWRFIKQSPHRTALEHTLFLVATLLVGGGAAICTWALARSGDHDATVPPAKVRSPYLFGQWLYTIGLASWAPLAGCILLIAGESLRTVRLMLRRYTNSRREQLSNPHWGRAARDQAVKLGIFFTMVIFSLTLVDRVAELLAGLSVLTATLLNFRFTKIRERQV